MTLSLTDTGQLPLKKLTISGTRVEGDVFYTDMRSTGSEDLPKISYSVRFTAPLFHEPKVTADLKGKRALDSPQVKVFLQKIAALQKVDLEEVKRVSSNRANRRNAVIMERMDGSSIKAFAKEAATELEKSLKMVRRVVVRGDQAVAICSDRSWMVFVMEGGKWKSDD